MREKSNLQVESMQDLWENHWRKKKNHRMTFLGRLITRQKQGKLLKLALEFQFINMIDIGSGLGFCLEIFHRAGIKTTGIDISKTAVEVCLKKGLDVSQKSVGEIDGQYNLVFSDGLLEHFISFRRYIRELVRISNKYVLIIQSDHQTVIMRLFLLLEQIFRKDKNVYEYNYRIRDFLNAFEENGCKLIKQVPVFCSAFKILLFKKA